MHTEPVRYNTDDIPKLNRCDDVLLSSKTSEPYLKKHDKVRGLAR